MKCTMIDLIGRLRRSDQGSWERAEYKAFASSESGIYVVFTVYPGLIGTINKSLLVVGTSPYNRIVYEGSRAVRSAL